jgi:hypothetical protein
MGMSEAKVPVNLRMVRTGCGGILGSARPPRGVCSLWKVVVQVWMRWSSRGTLRPVFSVLVTALVLKYGARPGLIVLSRHFRSYCYRGQMSDAEPMN